MRRENRRPNSFAYEMTVDCRARDGRGRERQLCEGDRFCAKQIWTRIDAIDYGLLDYSKNVNSRTSTLRLIRNPRRCTFKSLETYTGRSICREYRFQLGVANRPNSRLPYKFPKPFFRKSISRGLILRKHFPRSSSSRKP